MRLTGSGNRGFTLIELMIVVAIIALLASVATTAYTDYIENARTTKVLAHYKQAHSYVSTRFNRVHSQAALGMIASLPASTAEWIDEINPTGALAPSGGNAYVAGTGNAVLGAIGIQSSGSWATGDAQVIVTRPAYAGIASTSVTVSL